MIVALGSRLFLFLLGSHVLHLILKRIKEIARHQRLYLRLLKFLDIFLSVLAVREVVVLL